MKNSFKAVAFGLVLAFASTAAQAMSELTSVTVTPLWPTNSDPGNLLLYRVDIQRTGSGLLDVKMGCVSLPSGCNATFSTSSIRFTGNKPESANLIMSVMANQPTPVDCCAFKVTATAQRETITLTNVPSTSLRLGDVPSVMVTAIRCPGGDLEVRGMGDSGQTYRIEGASSMLNSAWSPVGTCKSDGNGRFTFLHCGVCIQGPPMQFYRAVKVTSGN